jgi:thymidylate kinase
MKLIIIEGGDRLGKSTLIAKLAEHFNFDNVTVRHFGKPPKVFPEGVDPLTFQMECFYKEAFLVEQVKQMEEDEYNYYENIVIWNRAHLGEYVYGQMFRGLDPEQIKNALLNFEERFLLYDDLNVSLILLTAEPEFFHKREDGNSLSKTIDQKTRELALFDEAFHNSSIDKKLRLKVNIDKEFLPKDFIFNKVIDFLKDEKGLN